MQCGQTHWKIFAKRERILLSLWKSFEIKHTFFSKKRFHPKVFVWTLRIQFCPLRRKLVNRKPKLCRSKFEIDKKKHFFNDLFSEYVSVDNNAVWTTTPKIINKIPKCFHPMTRDAQKYKFPKEIFSLQDVSMNSQNAVLAKPPKPFWQKEEIFLLDVRKRSNRVVLFEEGFFFVKMFLCTLEVQF